MRFFFFFLLLLCELQNVKKKKEPNCQKTGPDGFDHGMAPILIYLFSTALPPFFCFLFTEIARDKFLTFFKK